MSDDFEHAVAHILRLEGGFVHHPKDPGGATHFGITLRVLQSIHPNADLARLKQLTIAEAKEIYRRLYWDGPQINALPRPLALFVFDGAVNHGPVRAVKFLQKALGIAADGKIGPITLAASEAAEQGAILFDMAARRGRFYGALAQFPHFGLGWMRRLFTIYTEALKQI